MIGWMRSEKISRNSSRNLEIHADVVEYASGRVDYVDHVLRTKENRIASNKASTRIKLRLNQNEESNLPLMRSMVKLREHFEGIDADVDLNAFRDTSAALTVTVEQEAAAVIGREWDRVKTGEHGFRLAKSLAYIALLLSLAGIVWLTKLAGH